MMIQEELQIIQLNMPTQDKIFDTTKVTITLKKLLKFILDLQTYLQQLHKLITITLEVVDINTTIIDSDIIVIFIQLRQYKLTNVLFNGGSKVNFIANHICKYLQLLTPKVILFIVWMTNNVSIILLEILTNVPISIHGIMTSFTFAIIKML